MSDNIYSLNKVLGLGCLVLEFLLLELKETSR